jgi:hypothetical protein
LRRKTEIVLDSRFPRACCQTQPAWRRVQHWRQLSGPKGRLACLRPSSTPSCTYCRGLPSSGSWQPRAALALTSADIPGARAGGAVMALISSRMRCIHAPARAQVAAPAVRSIQPSATDPRSRLHDRKRGRILRWHVRTTHIQLSTGYHLHVRQSKSCSMGGNGCPKSIPVNSFTLCLNHTSNGPVTTQMLRWPRRDHPLRARQHQNHPSEFASPRRTPSSCALEANPATLQTLARAAALPGRRQSLVPSSLAERGQ